MEQKQIKINKALVALWEILEDAKRFSQNFSLGCFYDQQVKFILQNVRKGMKQRFNMVLQCMKNIDSKATRILNLCVAKQSSLHDSSINLLMIQVAGNTTLFGNLFSPFLKTLINMEIPDMTTKNLAISVQLYDDKIYSAPEIRLFYNDREYWTTLDVIGRNLDQFFNQTQIDLINLFKQYDVNTDLLSFGIKFKRILIPFDSPYQVNKISILFNKLIYSKIHYILYEKKMQILIYFPEQTDIKDIKFNDLVYRYTDPSEFTCELGGEATLKNAKYFSNHKEMKRAFKAMLEE